MVMKAPCLGCEERSISCHPKCLKYIDYVQANEVRKAEIKAKKIPGSLLRSHKRDACEKQRRKHERH